VTLPAAFTLSAADARAAAARFGTPCYVYDEATLRALARVVVGFRAPFGLVPRFAPSRAVLRVFHDEGLHFDASTVWEARRVVAAGIPAEKVEITSQLLGEGFEALARQGARVIACSLAQVEQFGRAFAGGTVGIRVNPTTARTSPDRPPASASGTSCWPTRAGWRTTTAYASPPCTITSDRAATPPSGRPSPSGRRPSSTTFRT
jgi:diaminopimelate decarboxylase